MPVASQAARVTSRREFLRVAGLLSLGAGLLSACSAPAPAAPAAQPALAASWETPNDTTWRFKLRQGVKFHDGSPFNATVAKYSLERFVDPNTKNPEAAVLKPITVVKVVDEATLELTTDGPF